MPMKPGGLNQPERVAKRRKQSTAGVYEFKQGRWSEEIKDRQLLYVCGCVYKEAVAFYSVTATEAALFDFHLLLLT